MIYGNQNTPNAKLSQVISPFNIVFTGRSPLLGKTPTQSLTINANDLVWGTEMSKGKQSVLAFSLPNPLIPGVSSPFYIPMSHFKQNFNRSIGL